MSISILVWILLFLFALYLSFFRRPIWSIILYFQIFFFHPYYWWWGRPLRLPGVRWSLLVGLICIAVYFLYRSRDQDAQNTVQNETYLQKDSFINLLMIGLTINYFFVHYLLANGSVISSELFYLGIKFVLLFVLIRFAVKSMQDFVILFFFILFGMGYLGYQVAENGAASIVAGRLEYIPLPSAETSNFLGSLLCLFLPSFGAFFFCIKDKSLKFLSLLCLPYIANLLFLVNSRSAFLGVIAAGVYLLFFTRTKEWKILSVAICLALVAFSFLAKDVRIMDRFMTTFAAEDDRDQSAAGRFDLWTAGSQVLMDYPMGSGGDGFKSVHSLNYFGKYKAVHNGHLAFAINWGFQGIFLYYLMFLVVLKSASSASKYLLVQKGLHRESFFGKCLIAGVIGFCVDGFFSNTLDDEWCFWMLAIMYSYTKLAQQGKFVLQYNTPPSDHN